jgi:hypothetical protein
VKTAENLLADAVVAASDDPYAQLDDLMRVIEELCPVWPERPLTRTDPELMRL